MLVSTIEVLQKHITTIVNNSFGKYETFIEDANIWIKRELLGTDLYNVIKDLTDQDATHAELVKRAERIVANKAFLDAIPFNDLIETDSGFAVIDTETKSPASQKRVDRLIEGVIAKLSQVTDELIDYLEETATYHEDWKGSPVYSLISDTFIPTLREFVRFAPFDGTRLDFVKSKPQMLSAINLRIAPVISTDLVDQVIEQIRDNDLTVENKAIMRNLKFAFAYFSIGDEKNATPYLMRVRKIIMSSPDSYTAFRDSDLYATIQAKAEADNSGTLFRTAL